MFGWAQDDRKMVCSGHWWQKEFKAIIRKVMGGENEYCVYIMTNKSISIWVSCLSTVHEARISDHVFDNLPI
jgi:hypothetical protein